MNVLGAMEATVRIAIRNGMKGEGSLSLEHIISMQEEMRTLPMSEDKLNRWLGWAQAAVVADKKATLDDMREINRGHL